LRKNKPSGLITRQARSKVRKILDTWLSSIELYNSLQLNKNEVREHNPVFITLTLCAQQRHSDEYIKRSMLSQFLIKLSNNHGISNWFWRAEKQKNGNIHFHIIIDKYIPFVKLNKYWFDILEKEGYLAKFFEKFGHKNPPSVNVVGCSNVSDFLDYVIKYCTKNESPIRVEGRVYGMSDNLRNLKPFVTNLDSSISHDLISLRAECKSKRFDEDFASVTVFFGVKLFSVSTLSFHLEYRAYLLSVYNSLYLTIVQPPCIDNAFDAEDNAKDMEFEWVQGRLALDLSHSCDIAYNCMFESEWW
jgi:hypothetical protein